jgi:hypothetical protein
MYAPPKYVSSKAKPKPKKALRRHMHHSEKYVIDAPKLRLRCIERIGSRSHLVHQYWIAGQLPAPRLWT